MNRYHRRRTPDLQDNLTAGLVAAGLALGVAAASFYLVRLYLAREPLEPLPSSGPGGERSLPPPDQPEGAPV